MFNSSHQADRILIDLADSDALWGPLLFLRPQAAAYLGAGRVFLASALVGGIQGMAANVGMAVAHRITGYEMLPVYTLPIVLSLALAIVLQVTIARAWNRRVERLARTRAWSRDTTR